MFQWFKNWCQTRFEPSYQFDENHENVVRKLIEHRGEVEFLESNDQEFVLKLGEYYFSLWIANYPYAYLSRIKIGELKRDRAYQKGEWWKCIDDLVCLDGGMPSNQTIVDFHNSFHVVCKDAQKAAQHFKQTKIVNEVLAKLH